MIYIIKLWKEITIFILIMVILFMINKYNNVKHEFELTKINHTSAIIDFNLKMAESKLNAEIERKKDLENYARKIATFDAKYSNLVVDNNRMQSEILKYNDRLSTYPNEANTAYAKAASTIYAECRGEYLKMGHYAEKLNAELDKVTKTP